MAISKNLIVKFLGDSSQLQGVYSTVTKDAQKFDKEIKKHGVSMQAVGKTMLAVGGTIVGALAATVVAVSKTGVEIDKMSKTTGVSREEIQKLGYAALQEHASMEQLSAGLVKLSKNMYDANMGTGEAKDTFEELGISVKKSDGTLRSSSDVLLDVADKFKGMTNETEISGAAMKIFGKSGAELVPFLRMGRDGIEELKKEAERLGIVMNEDAVKNMKAFDDSMTAVKAGVGGFATQIASALIPYMNKLADGLKAALEWFNKIPKPMRDAVTVGTALVGALSLVAGIIVTAVIPALTAMGAATALATGGISLLVAGLVYLGSTNQKATAIIWDVWDRAIAFLYTAWKGLETSCWALIREMLKALNTLTGWIPGWGKGLNAAILAVEKERQASLLAANNGWNTVIKGTYNEHYNWLVANNKKKNDTIVNQDKEADQQKQLQLKEAQDKEKKAAEERAKMEAQMDSELLNAKLQTTKNLDKQLNLQLEQLKAEKKKEIDEAAKAGVSTAKIEQTYKLKEAQIRKEAADKKVEIENDLQKQLINSQNDLTENLTEQKNIRIKLLDMEKDEAIKTATEQGTDVNKVKEIYKNQADAIEKDYADGVKKINDSLKTELLSSQQSLTKNLLEQKNNQIKLLQIQEDAATEQATREGQTQEQIAQIYQIYANRKLAIENNYTDDITAAKRQQTTKLMDVEQEYYDIIVSSGQSSYAERIAALKEVWRIEFQFFENEKKEAIRIAKEKGEDVETVEKTYEQRRINLLKNEANETKRIRQQNLAMWFNISSNVVNRISGLYSQYYDNKSQELENWYKQQQETIKNTVDDETTKNIALKSLDEEYNKKKTEIEREQAEKTKTAAIFDAIIKTAQSVMQALAAYPPPISFVMAGLAAAAGAVQLKLIQDQPLPELAEGGITTGATKFIAGEGKYQEAILPLSDEIFNRIGEGIVSSSTNNTTNNNSNPTVISNDNRTYKYELGRYVDKSGLKRLARDIQPILTAEDKRKGKK
jgi:hypothetical protein